MPLDVNRSFRVFKLMAFVSRQRQYHSQIDNLIEETVKEMTTLLVAKVTQADQTPGERPVCWVGLLFCPPWRPQALTFDPAHAAAEMVETPK